MLLVTPLSSVASQTDVASCHWFQFQKRNNRSTPSPDITTGSQSTISQPDIADIILPSQ